MLRLVPRGLTPIPARGSFAAQFTASFGNAVQVGIPLAAALYGEAGLGLHVTLVSLHSLTLLTVLTALVASYREGGTRELATNQSTR